MPGLGKIYKSSRYGSSFMVLFLDLCVSVIASLFAVFAVRFFSDPFGSLKHFVYVWTVSAAIASVVGFMITGTPKIVIRHSTYKTVGKLMAAAAIKESLLAILIFFGVFRFFGLYSIKVETEVVLVDVLLTFVMLVAVRVVIIMAYQVASNDDVESNVGRLGVFVYGVNNKAVAMVTRLLYSPHYNVIGFISDDRSQKGKIIQDRQVYYIEAEDELKTLKQKLGVECVLFPDESSALSAKDSLVPMCLDLGLHILTSPRIDDVTFGNMSNQAIHEVSSHTDDFIPDGMSSLGRNTKRLIDFVLAGILLVIFSPAFLICFILIKCEDHGPAIYKQERIGRFGRPFKILKFRSMKVDAEAAGPALYSGDEDPRLTKVGKFLRQHHLDELPQLWNVFVGQMAFIGYRPERKFYIDKIMEVDPRYYYLYQIRPGVTSYATLYNGYTDTIEKMLKRLEYDLYYLRHRSLWFDMKILWMTFCSIVFGKKF